MEKDSHSRFDIPSLMPTCNDLEGAVEDILRPLKAAVGIFWAFNQRPEDDNQQTIIDLCLLMADAACQTEYLIHHSSIDGKSVALAVVDHPCTKDSSRNEVDPIV